MLQRMVLALCALVFAGVGLVFITAPDALLPRVNITAPPGTANADIRAVYGGLDLGVGLFLAFCLVRNQVTIGLYASVFALGGLAFGRIVGIALHLEQDMITYYLLASEVLGAALALVALWLARTRDASSS